MKNPSLKQILTIVSAACLALQCTHASNLLLTNSDLVTPGSGGYWPNAANWNSGVAPGPNDVVVLSNSVISMSGYTGPGAGPYYAYIQGLDPDPGWTNSFDGYMPPTSIVDTMAIGGLWVPQTNFFGNWAVANQFPNGCHNLYITNQLNVVSTNARDFFHIYSNSIAIGTGYDGNGTASSGISNLVYFTVQGSGSLNVTNPNGCMWVGQGSQGAGSANSTHAAILDMSGLNTFNCVLEGLYTACDFNTVNSGTDPTLTGYARPQGAILFALTNNITLLDTNFPALIIGFENNNNGSSYCISNCLGKQNYLNFDQMLIGGPKASSSVGGMYFMPTNYLVANQAGSGVPALTDCYAKFRNVDGISRQTAWILGDDYYSLGTTTTAYGNANFNRGGIDALVDTIYLGRGATPLTNTVLNSTATAVGSLIYGAGTTNTSIIDVNKLELGDMLNYTAPCQGSIQILSNATLNVHNYVRLINTPPGASSSLTSRGFMFVYGGTVNVSGNIVSGGLPVFGYSLLYVQYGGILNMQPTNTIPPGNISVMTLQLAKGSLQNFGTLNVSNLVVLPPNTNFSLTSGQALCPGGLGYSDTLTIGATNTIPGSLTLQLDGTYITNNGNGCVGLSLNNSTLIMDLGTSSDKININGNITLTGINQIYVNPVAGFGPGTYPILTYNTNVNWLDCNGSTNYGLIGNVATQLVAGGPITNSSYVVTFDSTSTPGVINMIVSLSTPTALTWVGDGAANTWDVVGANNWNNGGGASKFYQFDSVIFSDSGSASPSVNLTAAVYPNAVTSTASENYTIAGPGQIAGTTSLNKSGTGDINLLTTNSYSGGTTVTAGTLRLGNGVSVSGYPGIGAVSIGSAGNLAIDVPVNQTQYLTNALTGSGLMTVEGPGKVVLISTNQTYTGSYKVTNGILMSAYWISISSNSTSASKQIYVTNSGSFDINGLNLANYITISGSGYAGLGALVNNGLAQANASMQVFMAGDSAIGGIFRMDLNGLSSTPSGLTGNGFNLTKVGTNCISLYNNSTNIFTNNIGNIGVNSGVLRVQNGSLLTTNPLNTITVAGGATLEMNNLWVRAAIPDSAILQNGSCLYGTGGTGTNITSGFTNLQGNIYFGTINLNGTDVFDVSTNSVLNIVGVISGNGTLVKGIGSHPASATTPVSTGMGTLFLSGVNTFNGSLIVQTGTVVLTNSGSVGSASSITLAGGVLNVAARTDSTLTVGASQTLKGVGTLLGTLVVPANGIIAPGNPLGLITNIGNAFLSGTANMNINKTNGVISFSQLGVSGGLQLGGTINVVFSGSGLTNGDKFQLFSSAVISSNFANVNLPAGYIWTNNLSVDGSITVAGVQTEPTNPPTLTALPVGANFTLSWPTAYYSYILQSQTNTLNVGLSSNWVTVPTVNNTITIPINPANGSVFYRLKH